MVAESEVGMSNYLLLGSESALADRALSKLLTALREDDYEISTIYCEDAEIGDVSPGDLKGKYVGDGIIEE